MLVIPNTAGPGAFFTLRIKRRALGLDLTLATAVSVAMRRRDGSTATLALTILAATARELVATYSFLGTEFTTTGAYYLAPSVVGPGGSIPCESATMYVSTPFDCRPVYESDTWLVVDSEFSPVSAAVSQTWILVNASGNLSPFQPWAKTDSTAGILALDLWAPSPGDLMVLSDYKHKAAIHKVTLVASAGTQVPVGDGTFAASVDLTTAGFLKRLKYDAGEALWIDW